MAFLNFRHNVTSEEVGYNTESAIAFSEIRWFLTNVCIYIWYSIKSLFNKAERYEELACKKLFFSKEEVFPKQLQSFLGSRIWHRRPLVKEMLMGMSEICRVLAENPASDAMLRIVYPDYNGGKKTTGIDKWLSKSLPGQALRDRLVFCSEWLAKNFVKRAIKNGSKIIDLGGGSGSYATQTMKQSDVNAFRESGCKWDHLDIDPQALGVGTLEAEELGMADVVTFRKGSFMSSKAVVEKSKFTILIGVLCGFNKKDSIALLKRIKIHLTPDAEILVATLTTKSFEEAPLAFRVLCNVLGWKLRPKTLDEIREVFKFSGWEIIEIMSERTDKNGNSTEGEYAIVHAKVVV